MLKRVDQSHLTMESLRIDLVPNSYTQLCPDNTLNSFTNFLPKQLNLETHWDVAVLEVTHPSVYQKVTEGKSVFFDKNFETCLNFKI